jgi:hypothetical protein
VEPLYHFDPLYHLNERIRQLCAQAANASEDEAPEVLEALQGALRKHSELMRKMVAGSLQPPSSSNAAD